MEKAKREGEDAESCEEGGSPKRDKFRGQEKKLDLDDPCGFLPS